MARPTMHEIDAPIYLYETKTIYQDLFNVYLQFKYIILLFLRKIDKSKGNIHVSCVDKCY